MLNSRVIYGTRSALGNKYLCPGLKGDAFPDDCSQGGKRTAASLRDGVLGRFMERLWRKGRELLPAHAPSPSCPKTHLWGKDFYKHRKGQSTRSSHKDLDLIS